LITDTPGIAPATSRGYCRVHFVTGATGLLASEYIAHVLDQDENARLRLLVRADSAQNAARRVDELMAFLFPDQDAYTRARPRVLALWGDITQPYLGLDERDWHQLSREVDIIFHAASLADRDATLETSRLVNVHGTRQVIDLAYACGSRLERLLHVSSAYVSGTRGGNLLPDELDLETAVSDHYQQTCAEAEALIRKVWQRIPVTIVRPSTVLGNAESGRALACKNFYLPLQLLYGEAPLALPVSARARVDLVPSNWAAEVAYSLLRRSDTAGRCYHLTAGAGAVSNRELRDLVISAFAACGEQRRGYRLVPRLVYNRFQLPRLRKIADISERMLEKLERQWAYMQFRRTFDNSSTLALSGVKSTALPDLGAYLPALLRYAINHHWRRQPAPATTDLAALELQT